VNGQNPGEPGQSLRVIRSQPTARRSGATPPTVAATPQRCRARCAEPSSGRKEMAFRYSIAASSSSSTRASAFARLRCARA
jgi:hypothetical protein